MRTHLRVTCINILLEYGADVDGASVIGKCFHKEEVLHECRQSRRSNAMVFKVLAIEEKKASPAKRLEEMPGFDPYLHDEADPAKCCAIKSSLWELEMLKQHYAPMVARFVEIFEKPFTNSKTCNIEDFVDSSNTKLFDFILHKKVHDVPLAFEPCSTLFSETDSFSLFWKLE